MLGAGPSAAPACLPIRCLPGCGVDGGGGRSLDEGHGDVQLRHALLQRRMRPGKWRQQVPQRKLARPARRQAVVVVLQGGGRSGGGGGGWRA